MTQHKYGANGGTNLGISVVNGGTYANKNKNISGTIQCSAALKKHPQLRKKHNLTLKKILCAAFGKCAWFRRLCLLTERLNYDSNEQRTIKDIPVSGSWLSTCPKIEKKHCDRNVVGSTFLLTTNDSVGGNLNLCTPNGKFMKLHLKPNMIIAGKWAQHAHCNDKVNSKGRTAWTIYLDRRVFSSKFICNEPKHFLD